MRGLIKFLLVVSVGSTFAATQSDLSVLKIKIWSQLAALKASGPGPQNHTLVSDLTANLKRYTQTLEELGIFQADADFQAILDELNSLSGKPDYSTIKAGLSRLVDEYSNAQENELRNEKILTIFGKVNELIKLQSDAAVADDEVIQAINKTLVKVTVRPSITKDESAFLAGIVNGNFTFTHQVFAASAFVKFHPHNEEMFGILNGQWHAINGHPQFEKLEPIARESLIKAKPADCAYYLQNAGKRTEGQIGLDNFLKNIFRTSAASRTKK